MKRTDSKVFERIRTCSTLHSVTIEDVSNSFEWIRTTFYFYTHQRCIDVVWTYLHELKLVQRFLFSLRNVLISFEFIRKHLNSYYFSFCVIWDVLKSFGQILMDSNSFLPLHPLEIYRIYSYRYELFHFFILYSFEI